MIAIVLALAGATLIADAGPYKDRAEAAGAAEQRLAQVGEVLGAAWMCPEIDRARLHAVMHKVEAMIDRGVDDNKQYYAAHNILDKAIDKGKHESDCRRAETALGDIERELPP